MKAGSFYVKEGDVRLADGESERLLYDIDVVKWASVGGAVALLGLGYLTLLRMYYADRRIVTSAGASQIVGRSLDCPCAVDLGVPALSSVVRCGHVLSRASWCFRTGFEWYRVHVWRS